MLELFASLAENLKLLVLGPLAAGALALALSYTVQPTFTATTTLLHQEQSSAAASLMASLGAVASIGGATGTVRTPADQYVALMKSNAVSDRIIERFKLSDVYGTRLHSDTRKALSQNVRFAIGKKDGLITVEVDDESPQRAADIANQYVDELRRMTSLIAVTEAQRRRAFFETQLRETQTKLAAAQHALQATGVTQGTLKANPATAAEGYARLKAEVTAAEVRLQTLRRAMTDSSPEVLAQQATLAALRAQLSQQEQATQVEGDADYISRFREFKYQETLFELFSKQYELARVDESREGALVQVVDRATLPEKKSKPQRAVTAFMTTLLSLLGLVLYLVVRDVWRRAAAQPENSAHLARLRRALRCRARA